jgi:hypothetical protein
LRAASLSAMGAFAAPTIAGATFLPSVRLGEVSLTVAIDTNVDAARLEARATFEPLI